MNRYIFGNRYIRMPSQEYNATGTSPPCSPYDDFVPPRPPRPRRPCTRTVKPPSVPDTHLLVPSARPPSFRPFDFGGITCEGMKVPNVLFSRGKSSTSSSDFRVDYVRGGMFGLRSSEYGRTNCFRGEKHQRHHRDSGGITCEGMKVPNVLFSRGKSSTSPSDFRVDYVRGGTFELCSSEYGRTNCFRGEKSSTPSSGFRRDIGIPEGLPVRG